MFHPGYATRITRPVQRPRRQKTEMILCEPFEFSLSSKRWLLLPESAIPSFLQFRGRFLYSKNMIEATHALTEYGEGNSLISSWKLTVPQLEEARTLVFKNQRVRAAMSHLARTWLWRHLNKINSEDPITCEIPLEPIQIADWDCRSLYTFEARPFLRYILTQLTLHDTLFPTPVYPRNMFTNQIFSRGQLVAIQEQLAKYNHHHWLWDAFVSCQFNLKRFKIIFDKPLRNHILQSAFRDKLSESTANIVIDFIESEAQYHRILQGIPWRVLKWGLQYQKHPYLVKWRNLCKSYYRDATIDGNNNNEMVYHVKSLALLTDKEALRELTFTYTRKS